LRPTSPKHLDAIRDKKISIKNDFHANSFLAVCPFEYLTSVWAAGATYLSNAVLHLPNAQAHEGEEFAEQGTPKHNIDSF